MNINELYATPGFYDITTPSMRLKHRYVAVEVDSYGVCHQLNPQGQRDGALSMEGWNEEVIVLGPTQKEQ